MLYILGILAAGLIVAAQALWKTAVTDSQFELTKQFVTSKQMVAMLTSPALIGGVILYGIATFLYLGLLSKYDYAIAQSLVLVSSLILTFIVANIIFHERTSGIQLAGLALLIIGLLLVTRR